MKAKGFRIIANAILCIGVVACLLGTTVALLLSNGLIGISTDYVPQPYHYIILIAVLLACIITWIILHIVANVRAKRERIAACWAEAETVARMEEESTTLLEEVVNEAVAEEEAADEEAAGEEAEISEEVYEAEEEPAPKQAPQSKMQAVRAKIIEKTPITEEQLATAKKIGKVVLPVAGAALIVALAVKITSDSQKAARRKSLYKWLG